MRVKSFDSTRVFCWRASNLEVYNNNMECRILLLLLTHLLLVRAADDAVDSTQVKAGNVSAVNECYWSGEGPICDGKCRAGETVVSESKKNDGNGCIIGKKMYCCKGGAVLSSNNGTEAVAPHHVKRQHVIEVTNSSSTQGQLLLGDTKDDCYWVGKSPNCKGSCLEGDYMVNTSRTANGSTCIVGKKKYCCKGSGTNNTLNDVHSTHSGSSSSTTEAAPVKQMTNGNSSSSCYWVGKAPICLGSCRFGDYVADKSPTGDGGGKCESGQKKFCCARQQSTAPVSTEEPPPPLKTTTGSSIGQLDNVSNSISNWTSARPFQTRRRPTPRGLPINSTVTNRVKIVKIKRKLVMSTPTVANVSTSISMTSETSSTLAMAQSLLTLPSTTESTVTTTATSPSTTTESTTTSTSTTTATPTATPSTTATTASTTTASATTTTESTTTATAATTPSTTAPPTTSTTATTTTPSTTTALATTESTTTPSTTATTTTTIATPTTTTSSTTTTTESTTIETGTTSSTPIRHPIRHPTTLAARSTSTATESTSLATGPSTPASTSIKPTSARAPKKFEPFFNLPDILPVPLIFRIQKSADTDITSLAANIATTSIIQSSTTSTTPTTLE